MATRKNRPVTREVSAGIGSFAITKDDSATLDPVIRSLYVTGAGDVKFQGEDGQDDTWTVPANYIIPVRMKKVYSSGTTATGFHGIY